MNRFAQAEVSHHGWKRSVELPVSPPHCAGRCASGGKLKNRHAFSVNGLPSEGECVLLQERHDVQKWA